VPRFRFQFTIFESGGNIATLTGWEIASLESKVKPSEIVKVR